MIFTPTRPDIKMCNKVFKLSARTSAKTSGATSVGYKYIAQDCCRGLCRGPKIIPNKQLYESYRLPYRSILTVRFAHPEGKGS